MTAESSSATRDGISLPPSSPKASVRPAIEDITENSAREKGLVDQAIGALTKTVVEFVTEAFAQGEWALARTTDADSVESAYLPQREQA